MLPFVIKKQRKDTEAKNQLEQLEKDITERSNTLNSINFDLENKKKLAQDAKEEVNILLARQQEIKNHIELDQDIAQQSVDAVYKAAYTRMSDAVEKDAERLSAMMDANRTEYEHEYEDMLIAFVANFMKTQEQIQEDLAQAKESLERERSKADAARKANEREEEKRVANSKYRLLIGENDLLEIKRLKEIIPFMRNSRPISKIIWEGYFRQLTNDMINRVIGSGQHTGIYRITNVLNGKSYIGQSVDIAERFKQHIKCGLGIDTPNNILYNAMKQDGVENFSFEVLEECPRAELNDREIYWISYYKTNEFGYNMSRGGA